MSGRRSWLGLVMGLIPVAVIGQAPEYHGPSYVKEALGPGVWAFVFDNPLGNFAGVDGTAVVIVNDEDVVVVDTQWSPATARRVLDEIRKITPKPVRYVINTHWHGDHWFGNQVYRDAFPGVDFIAHPNTLADLEAQEVGDIEPTWKERLPQSVTDLQQRLANGKRRDGKAFTSADSILIRNQIAAFKWAIPVFKEVTPVRPTLLVADSLVLRRGDRTIVVRYLGRGNTRGDLTIWLPKERVLITGDLLVNPVPYSFGSYLSEWVRTLTTLRSLPAVAVVPGHGSVQRDWTYLDLFVELLQSTLAQTATAVSKGLDLEATRKSVDLSALKQRFTAGDDLRSRAFDAFFITPAIERGWLEARGELDKVAEH